MSSKSSSTGHALFTFRGPGGVPVEIHISVLVLVLIFVGLTGTYRDFPYDLIVVALLIVSILLHELGHLWACRVQGLRVRRIVVYAGGGFCEALGTATPRQQEFVAALGPIVNLAIWAVASLIWPFMQSDLLRWMVYTTANINLFLALLNLLPMNPLDGGKLLQLALMRLVPEDSATRITGAMSVVVAILWVPGMICCFLSTGLALFFLPSIRAHLNMARI